MEPTGCSETSATNYRTTLRNISDDRKHLHIATEAWNKAKHVHCLRHTGHNQLCANFDSGRDIRCSLQSKTRTPYVRIRSRINIMRYTSILKVPRWIFKKDSSVLRISMVFNVSPCTVHTGCRNTSVRIATRWWMDVPRCSRVSLRPIQPPVQCETRLFPTGKAAGAWRWPPTRI